ncbi:MAG: ABC transporter permease, partial [Clostridiales bacterium]|nr:ABC transporter permease [Clostridiales bacterium]
ENIKKQKPAAVYLISFITGIFLLGYAYYLGINGLIWEVGRYILLLVVCGLIGTFLVFYGMRFGMDKIARRGSGKSLHVFSFRQVQDTVICRSGTMAICSLLILFAVVCLGAGIGFYISFDLYEDHITDYTFEDDNYDRNYKEIIREKLEELGIADRFEELYTVRVGLINVWDDYETAFDMDEAFDKMDFEDPDYDYHYDFLRYNHYPRLIALSDYNRILEIAGEETIDLKENEIALYMDRDYVRGGDPGFYERILSDGYTARIAENYYRVMSRVYSTPLSMEYVMPLSLGVIVPDDTFMELTEEDYATYVNAILSSEYLSEGNTVEMYDEINDILDTDPDISYSCYIENMGRQLFYLVAASYTLIYLAIIFCVIGNTILGVQFLMGQKKSHRRYRTLIKLGATHNVLCETSAKQINWYFGIPLSVASMSAIFGVRSLYQGTLSSRTMSNMNTMLLAAGIVIVAFCLVECIYIWVVKRSSYTFLSSLMTPEREE